MISLYDTKIDNRTKTASVISECVECVHVYFAGMEISLPPALCTIVDLCEY